jgi:hypothetical protein
MKHSDSGADIIFAILLTLGIGLTVGYAISHANQERASYEAQLAKDEANNLVIRIPLEVILADDAANTTE